MIHLPRAIRIFAHREPVDMRKSYDTLAAVGAYAAYARSEHSFDEASVRLSLCTPVVESATTARSRWMARTGRQTSDFSLDEW